MSTCQSGWRPREDSNLRPSDSKFALGRPVWCVRLPIRPAPKLGLRTGVLRRPGSNRPIPGTWPQNGPSCACRSDFNELPGRSEAAGNALLDWAHRRRYRRAEPEEWLAAAELQQLTGQRSAAAETEARSARTSPRWRFSGWCWPVRSRSRPGTSGSRSSTRTTSPTSRSPRSPMRRPPRPAPPSADQMLPPGNPPPAGHGRGLDDVERVAPAREEPREEAPEQAIVAAQPAPGEPPTFVHHQLVAERDVLHEQIDACLTAPSHTGPPAIVGTRYRRILEADGILAPHDLDRAGKQCS